MRTAKDVEFFPYTSKTNCYILVEKDKVEQIVHYRKCDIQEVINAYRKVKDGNAKLYCVWPGNYRSDLFIIDDIEAFAEAFDIKD